ncbi:c-type cytochrome [Echinicola marina]|uniref:cbb3-type cytochrome c oxidase N-terminal domain-containing protein n=1 Tax=Echinicola marina TaxID=2859768 RepID=UPI001CF6721A|nr:cbb3-type cytochrome c oxidase N-terminal domain-containing protein [Echinicola marina]UCS93015.1 c-type cytochrome [Echinicola marina]
MKKTKIALMVSMLALITQSAMAQEAERGWMESLGEMDSSQLTLLIIIMVVLGLMVLLMILLIYLASFIVNILNQENPEMAKEPSWWENFKEKFVTGKLKPIEDEEEIQMDHSYDGIVELDNFMPPWLKYVFYGSILFAVVYLVNNTNVGFGKSPTEEYQAELAEEAIAAEERKALALASIDESNVAFDQSQTVLEIGGAIFQNNCVACHAADGGGGVGPNLTDVFWLHGGSISDVFTVIKYGVPEKGMIPWQDQLSPEEIQQVANFVLSLEGTTPSNPKEPQGEEYVRETDGETGGEETVSDSVQVNG